MKGHAAICPVALEILAAALRLPEGTIIRRVVDSSQTHGEVHLIVEHPLLPLVREGDRLTQVGVLLRTDDKPGTWQL
jgi:hypothetical protein